LAITLRAQRAEQYCSASTKALLVGSLLAFGTYTAQAEILEGRVVAVADGDTITILDASKQQHRIRINGIGSLRSLRDRPPFPAGEISQPDPELENVV